MLWREEDLPFDPEGKHEVGSPQELVRDIIWYLGHEGYHFISEICGLATPMRMNDQPTAYTVLEDNIAQIYLNMDYMNGLDNISQQSFVIVHELCHLLFGDLHKISNFMEEKNRFNKAADCVINDYLEKHYDLEPPPNLVHGQETVGRDCTDDVVEHVFNDVEPCEEGEGSGGKPGDGCGMPGDPIRGTNNNDILDRISEVARAHGADDIADAMDDAKTEEPGGSSGNEDGGLIQNVQDDSLPMDWDGLVRSFHYEFARRRGDVIAYAGRMSTSFRAPDRKMAYAFPEIFMPSEEDADGPGNAPKLIKPKVLVAVDASGSIGSEMLERFIGVVHSLDRSKVDVDIVTFSTYIHKYDLSLRPEQNQLASGGTSFHRVAEWVASYDPDSVDAVVMITDGLDEMPVLPPDQKDKWLMVCSPFENYENPSRYYSMNKKRIRGVSFDDFYRGPIKA